MALNSAIANSFVKCVVGEQRQGAVLELTYRKGTAITYSSGAKCFNFK